MDHKNHSRSREKSRRLTAFLISPGVRPTFRLLNLTLNLFLALFTSTTLHPVAFLARDAGTEISLSRLRVSPSFSQVPSSVTGYEYLWYEAEDMRGFATQPNGEPILNPSWQDLPRAKAPGWGMNGTGTSAEFTQGGASEWGSAAASFDETNATIYQEIEVPRAGEYRLWVRYADWARKSETFAIRITQNGRDVVRQEFGVKDLIDPHDETSMYWEWAFTWDNLTAQLQPGSAKVEIAIEKVADARRHVDAFVLTNDLNYKPDGRRKPDFAAMRYLREWSTTRAPLTSLLSSAASDAIPIAWQRHPVAGRDFMMPWNIAPEFWSLYDQPPASRPLYPFAAEPFERFVEKYKNTKDVPIFSSNLVIPVIYLNDVPALFKEGTGFVRYLRETKVPFAILINYASPQFAEGQGEAAWQLLNGEFKNQFVGWISGESIGHVWSEVAKDLRLSSAMSRKDLLNAYHAAYDKALTQKWQGIFKTQTGPMWDKLIPAQSTSSTSFAHPLSQWGVRLLGLETAAVMPMFGMRTAFTRGATRQFGGNFFYYHAPNFGDTATTFTQVQNFAGPNNFYHSRYGATMGPSLSWYRKSYYFYYMSGVSAFYLEQGYDQFFKPGPGDHEFQLNPLGRITDEFVKFAGQHPNRGTPYTPIAFLLDPAHGWDMTDYPHWPLGVSQLTRHDRALRELMSVAYYPGSVNEGEPASGDRQAYVSGVFGNIFDVLVAADSTINPLNSYRGVVVGGRIEWSPSWAKNLADYVRNGGTVVLNAAQTKGLPSDLLGVRLTTATADADSARCLSPGEAPQNLNGQMFRYVKVTLDGAQTLIESPSGDPLVTVKKVGKGSVIFAALPDLLGYDERVTPFAAHALAHVFADATPVKVRGDVEYLINRNDKGWVVTLLNNNGVFKPQQGMAQVDRSAVVKATISMKSAVTAAEDWINDTPMKVNTEGGESTVNVDVRPGGVAIVQLRSQ